MKNSVWFIAALFFISVGFQASTSNITITKKNGGPNGYNNVEEKHFTSPSGEDMHTLICSNPGYSPAEWMLSPIPTMKVEEFNDLLAQVDEAIAAGKENGAMFWDMGITANWTTVEGLVTINFHVKE